MTHKKDSSPVATRGHLKELLTPGTTSQLTPSHAPAVAGT